MRIEELRINNFVHWGKPIAEIKGIHTKNIGRGADLYNHLYVKINGLPNMNYHCVTLDEVDAILLNEEWLLKLGFDFIRNNFLFNHKEYHNNRINEGSFYLEPVGDAYNNWYLYHKSKMITSSIRYVHQLQNLYFILSGEELTISK